VTPQLILTALAKTVECQERAARAIVEGDAWSLHFADSFLRLADGWLEMAWDTYAEGEV